MCTSIYTKTQGPSYLTSSCLLVFQRTHAAAYAVRMRFDLSVVLLLDTGVGAGVTPAHEVRFIVPEVRYVSASSNLKARLVSHDS